VYVAAALLDRLVEAAASIVGRTVYTGRSVAHPRSPHLRPNCSWRIAGSCSNLSGVTRPVCQPRVAKLGASMQMLVGLVMLAAIGYGFGAYGIRGAATAAVADLAIGTGLATAYWRIGVNIAGTAQERAAQRMLAIVAAVGAAVGAYYGGWRWGWAWTLVGFVAGCVCAALLALFHLVDLGPVPDGAGTKNSTPGHTARPRAAERSADAVRVREDHVDRQTQSLNLISETRDVSGRLVVGEFDVSGLTVDTRTGKVGGNWTELRQGAAKRLDHQTVAELCRCCGVELLRSGSKWSVWFCQECKRRVEALNKDADTCVVPIGRHTLMHGIGLPGADAVRDPALVVAFSAVVNDFVAKQTRVAEWASEIVKRNCASCALTGDQPVPIATYLEAVAHQSRHAAFDAMCDWWRSFGHGTK